MTLFRVRDQLFCRFWGIFWIDASSEDNIERGLVNIATICGLAGDANVVKRWLSNVPETWLMIFDNADDPDLDLSRYFPVGARGTVLITTRNPECRHHAPPMSSWELGRMQVDEATTLILKTSGIDLSDSRTRALAEPVVLTLGCLALAVAQAGAVIRQGVCSMGEYCQLYSQRRKELLEQIVQGGEGYKYTVYTTWEISLQAIEAMSGGRAKDAVELLQMFSFLHHDGISEEIFHRAWTGLWNEEEYSGLIKDYQFNILLRQRPPQWDPREFRKALSILSSFSLISRDRKGLVSIHPLVHAWARDRLSCSDEEVIWTVTVSTVAVSVPSTFRTDDYRFRRSLVPHLDTFLGVYYDGVFHLHTVGNEYISIAGKFALIYAESGRGQEALQLIEKVVAANKRTLGVERPETLRSMHNLAISYSEVGRGGRGPLSPRSATCHGNGGGVARHRCSGPNRTQTP